MTITVLDRTAVGAPITRGGISLIPVYLPGRAPRRISGGGDRVTIGEAPDAEVPTITVTNAGEEPVLLVEGETVRGGQQDRTFDVSILIPAVSVIECPVSCVERGRWGGESDFGRSATYAPRRVRRAKHFSVSRNLDLSGSKHADQHLVWSTVDHELSRLQVDAPTGALQAADAALERDERAAREVRDLVQRGPLPEQRGVVVAHGRRIVACDLFASTELLAAHWEALVRGYALDRPDHVEGRPSLTRAVRFLRRFAQAPGQTADGVGLGTEHHVRSDRLVGQALVWEDALVHASAFALAA